jgi:hypothetical protein
MREIPQSKQRGNEKLPEMMPVHLEKLKKVKKVSSARAVAQIQQQGVSKKSHGTVAQVNYQRWERR